MTLRLTSFAKRELFRVHGYYEAKSTGLGDAFLDEVELALALIKAHPHAWSAMNSSVRRLRLKRFKYGVLCRVYGDEVVVFVVAHLAGRPAYWRKMMKAKIK